MIIRDIDGNEILKTSEIDYMSKYIFSIDPFTYGKVRCDTTWQKKISENDYPDATNLIDFLNQHKTNGVDYELSNGSHIEVKPLSNYLDFYFYNEIGEQIKLFNILLSPQARPLFLFLSENYCYTFYKYKNSEGDWYYQSASAYFYSSGMEKMTPSVPLNQYTPYDKTTWRQYWNGYNYTDTDPEQPFTQADTTQDNINFPDLPTIDCITSGFLNMYQLKQSQSNALIHDLWTDDFFENLPKIFNSPMESIISMRVYPFEIKNILGTSAISIGTGTFSTATGQNILSQFQIIDCGTIDILELFGNFTDYSPYTKAEIYLYGLGSKSLDINDIMDSQLQLKYYIDILTGLCVAMLKVKKNKPSPQLNSILYTWSGNIGMDIPISSANYVNMISGLSQSAMSIVGSTAMGNPMGIASGALSAVGSLNVPIQKSGAIGNSTSFLTPQGCYITLTRPVYNNNNAIEQTQGGILKDSILLSTIVGYGYTEIANPNASNIDCTDTEKIEIENLLKGGVFF